MTEKHFVLATAGHIDHGKSALVKALTGTDPDRLPEEKARGITIELGFAELVLAGPDEQRLHIGIVDVPGHEDFVRNMIAGVGSVDLALFVVATDDGWMPQTEEHLQILTYLGVQRAVIALTKSDLGHIDNVTAQIRHRLTGTAFEKSKIVPTSIRTGDGIDNLKSALASEFATLPPPRDIGKPRIFVDRAFTLRGIGTVVTGTLVGGRFMKGQNVIVQPRGVSTRIRSIQSHNRERNEIGPGARTALNLPELAAADIARGDVVTVSDLGEAMKTIDVALVRSSRLAINSPPVKNGASAYLHHGTSRVRARVSFAEARVLKSGETEIAQLRLESPVFAFVGDHFVLRDPSERHTLAGGVILDAQTNSERFRNPKQHELLAARAEFPGDVIVAIRSELQRDGARDRADLLVRSNFDAREIADAIERLAAKGDLVVRDEVLADAKWWTALRDRAIEAIEKEHKNRPQLTGLDLAKLRSELADVSSKIFEAVIVDLCQSGYARADNRIRRAEHRAVLPEDLVAAAETIRRLISEKPFDPPARKQVAQDRQLQQALRFLVEQGEVIEIGDNVVLSAEATVRMQSIVQSFISKRGPATVSELRRELGTSRRILVPFLEYLDRRRITQREGDRRKLRDQENVYSTSNLLQ